MQDFQFIPLKYLKTMKNYEKLSYKKNNYLAIKNEYVNLIYQ